MLVGDALLPELVPPPLAPPLLPELAEPVELDVELPPPWLPESGSWQRPWLQTALPGQSISVWQPPVEAGAPGGEQARIPAARDETAQKVGRRMT